MADPESQSEKKSSEPKKKSFLAGLLPRIVFLSFGLISIFVIIAVVVSGLVLSGTVQVEAKAIGLTQSLVLFSSVFSVTYIGLHTFAARRASLEAIQRQPDHRPVLHTRLVILSRITLGFWATSTIAVAVTLGSKSAPKDLASKGALQSDLAACIVNCLCTSIVDLVVERSSRPFVLLWITPPTPVKQTTEAKALIHGILGDGLSGHPSDASDDKQEKKPIPEKAVPVSATETVSASAVSSRDSLRSDEDGSRHTDSFFVSPRQEHREPIGFSVPRSTPSQRQRLWQQVDEGGRSSPTLVATMPPSPARTSATMAAATPYPPSPKYHKAYVPFQYPPGNTSSASNASHTNHSSPTSQPATPTTLRPAYRSLPSYRSAPATPPAAPATPATPVRPPYGGRRLPSIGENSQGKRLFDEAVRGLRVRDQARANEWADVKVPGAYYEW